MNAGVAAPAGFEPGQKVVVDGVPGIVVGVYCLPVQLQYPDGRFETKTVPAGIIVLPPEQVEAAALQVLPMKAAR